MVVIDASVWVTADSADDIVRDACAAFLSSVLGQGLAIHQPTLTLVEVTAAVGRRTRDEVLAREASTLVASTPGLVLHDLDMAAAVDAAAVATRTFLRGADAVYAACALRTGSTLVTLDRELLDRPPAGIDVTTPTAWLERQDRPA